MTKKTAQDLDHTALYLHLQKAAGTTMWNIFRDNYEEEALCYLFGNPAKNSPEHLAKIERLCSGPVRSIVFGSLLRNLPVFTRLAENNHPHAFYTMLREPVDRLLSYYYYELHLDPALHGEADLADLAERGEDAYRQNLQTKSLASLGDPRGWDEPCTAQDLERAKRNLAGNVACFGLVERFAESYLLFAERLGLEGYVVKRRNVTASRPAREALDPAVRRRIAAANAHDVELYAFAAELFAERVDERGQAFRDKARAVAQVKDAESVQTVSAGR